MSYKEFIGDHKKDDIVEIEINELTLGWIASTPEKKAKLISEVKETKDAYKIQLIKEIAEDAKNYDISLEEYKDRASKEDWAKANAKLDKASEKLDTVPRKDFGKALNKVDDNIDKVQDKYRNLKNIPIIGKDRSEQGKRAASMLGSVEAGTKAAKVTNALGADPSTSTRVMLKTARGIEAVKGAGRDVGSAVSKTGESLASAAKSAKKAVGSGLENLKDKAGEVGEKVADAAKEHGGKIGAVGAAGIGAGLGALALAKKLRKGKAKQSE